MSRLSTEFREPSSTNVKFPAMYSVVIPEATPSSNAEISIASGGEVDAAIGESVTCAQPSNIVAFPGTLNPLSVVSPPEVFTVAGPAHDVVAAFVIGTSNISSTRAPASLLRLFDMLSRIITDIMNELVS